MMKRIRNTSEIVKSVLEQRYEARGNNDTLYAKVCERVNEECLSAPMKVFLSKRKEFNVPSFESVTRCRRKVQSEYPELRADDTVEGYRAMNEEIVKEYAKEVLV